MNNITVQLYADKYAPNNLTTAILNKQLGFELSIDNSLERNRRILTLEEVRKLRDECDQAISDYHNAIKELVK